MAYTKTTWVNGTAPAINDTNLNKIEQGIFDSLRQDGTTSMSAQLITVAGSAATPAIAPTGDSNTGIFFPSADTIAFSEGGAESFRLTSDGNLLIGTTTNFTNTTNSGALALTGIATRQVEISSGTPDTTSNAGIYYQNSSVYSGDNGATSKVFTGLYIAPQISNNATGGTNSLDVYGARIINNINNTATTARFTAYGIGISNTRNSSNDLSTNTNNSLFGITIGTNHSNTLPTTAVTGSAASYYGNLINSSGTMNFAIGNQQWIRCGFQNTALTNTTNSAEIFSAGLQVGSATGGTSTLTNAYGYRIGAINVGASGTLTNFYGLYIATPTVTGTLTNRWAIYTTDANMPSSHAGYFLIGYTSSNGAYPLQVNGQIFATSSTIATSDGRYKKDIKPITDGLDIVKKLNPVQFNWKEHKAHNFNTDTLTVGFIAQEVQEVLKDKPFLNSVIKKSEVTWETETDEFEEIDEKVEIENDDGTFDYEIKKVLKPIKEKHSEEFYGIAESNLIAILTKAVQELTAKVEALEEKLSN